MGFSGFDYLLGHMLVKATHFVVGVVAFTGVVACAWFNR